MKIENFFLRYAYPCAYIIKQRGELTQKELVELENIAVKNKEISKERLEKIFHRAFLFIDELARKRGKGRWHPDIIKEYFYSYHNEVIDRGQGVYKTAPPMLKELSRVDIALVTDKKDSVLVVKYGKEGKERKRNVMNSFVPSAKIGDKIKIHYGYGIEIVK